MKTLAGEAAGWGWDVYDRRWRQVARDGVASVALDTRARGWRYLSLDVLALSADETTRLRRLTERFGWLLDVATSRLLEDREWWGELAWPWPAIELARQEPAHPGGRATLYGRFDWLLDDRGEWQLVEYNADTPSGGREVAGLEAPILRLHRAAHPTLSRLSARLERRLAAAILARLRHHERDTGRPVTLVGVVSAHGWVEDMAQAWWLAGLLRASGQRALVGDVVDLAVSTRGVTLRGQRIDALYRFYPIERLYRHGLFAPLLEAAIDRRLLLLNGLRGFLGQSKATLAWLWSHRADPSLGRGARTLVERHLPETLPARHPNAPRLVADGVVKHVNGREGDAVTFGETLDADGWEARLLEGGYVVQRRVRPAAVEEVAVDELRRSVAVVEPRYPCVGAFCIGGQFGGCYTRIDGPITSARAAFVPTLQESAAGGPAR